MSYELVDDPARLPSIGPPWPTNPLAELSDEQLGQIEFSLRIACGKGKSALREKHRKYLCLVLQVARVEKQRRAAGPI